VDLRDSPLLVPVAQALVALPLVVRTLVPVLASVDDRLRQAAATLGAPPWRASLTVDLPVMGRPLLAAAGFAFAVSLGEFGATSFLARDEHPTLPVVIFGLIGHPGPMNYGMALAASVVLAATTAGVMLTVERLYVRPGDSPPRNRSLKAGSMIHFVGDYPAVVHRKLPRKRDAGTGNA
jgi:thiamine transport system permease protein